jgi:hypothetical protein
MPYREIASALAIVLTFVGFYPYLWGILRGTIQPHVFSWVIWSVTTLVAFLAQLEAQGGLGAWPMGVSGAISGLVAVFAYLRRADVKITKGDWLFFWIALSSLPLWYITSDPLWAVIVLTTVDLLGFGPTVRKAYFQPASESLLFFAVFAIRNGFSILALERYSVATVLFPAAVGVACILVILLILYRRRRVVGKRACRSDIKSTGF